MADRLFSDGIPNPERFGFALCNSAGEAPDLERLHEAAKLLDRQLHYTDDDGYEREIIGTAVGPRMCIAYVESRAKVAASSPYRRGRFIDITIRIHLAEPDGGEQSVDIESYNPYFGCDVRFFEWVEDTAVLIYREKHRTYACRFGDTWPPTFVEIEDDWMLHGDQLGYIGYRETTVRRLTFPELQPLPPISLEEAKKAGLLPRE